MSKFYDGHFECTFLNIHKLKDVQEILLLLMHQTKNLTRRMTYSGMLRRVALVRIYVSEELSASIIRVTRIGELGTALAISCEEIKILHRAHNVQKFSNSDCYGPSSQPSRFYLS
jgi:hypothetical protein